MSKVTEYTSTVKCATEPRSSWRREWWEPVLEPRSRLSEQGRGQATTSPRDGNTCTREVGGATASVFPARPHYTLAVSGCVSGCCASHCTHPPAPPSGCAATDRKVATGAEARRSHGVGAGVGVGGACEV